LNKPGPHGIKKREKYEREASEILNKHKRQEVVLRRRMAAREDKKLKTLQTRKLREELGEEAVPKGKNNTIEGMRVPDETMIEDLDDEDIVGEQNIDEFDKYFNRETTPKILVTTNRRPKGVSSVYFNFY
jgi:ribosome production factor 1